MRSRIAFARGAAWMLAAALASCSHEKKEQAPPPKPTAAEQSQKSFQLAAQEQRELVDQQSKVETAHAGVVAAQEQLSKAQAQEQQELLKAQQLQERANLHVKEGMRSAQMGQAGAPTAGLEGLQTVTGTVAQVTSSQVVLQARNGRPMTFDVDSRTRVLLGTEQRSVSDIQRGADAQVAYDPRVGATALIIRVTPAGTVRPPAQQQPAPQPQH